eukprot:m51a1_g8219 putative adp-ribosylation factor-like protein 5b-like (183) ;mRNA; f:97959-98917
MGGVLAKLWGWAFKLPEFKVVVVGLTNAGKTTIVYRLLLNDVVATTPTVGSNVEELVYKNLRFLMWDLGGSEMLRDSWSTYYTNTHAVIFVVDSSDRERLNTVREELHKILSHDLLKQAVVLVYANKQDLRGAMSAADLTQAFALHALKDREWHVQSCCALTGEGLNEGLEWIATKFRPDTR